MSITLDKKEYDALSNLIATARAVAEKYFLEDATKEILESADIAMDLVFNAEVDYTDWDSIDNLGQALIDFGKDAA